MGEKSEKKEDTSHHELFCIETQSPKASDTSDRPTGDLAEQKEKKALTPVHRVENGDTATLSPGGIQLTFLSPFSKTKNKKKRRDSSLSHCLAILTRRKQRVLFRKKKRKMIAAKTAIYRCLYL